MQMDYEDKVAELLDLVDSGEITFNRWEVMQQELTVSYERAVDTVAENLKEYGHDG